MTVPAPIVEWAPDKGPYELVDTYANLTGASGAYVSTPDSAAVSITGDLDLRADLSLTDWTPSEQQAVVAKWNIGGANSLSFEFLVFTDGFLRFRWANSGGTQTDRFSSSVVPFGDGTRGQIRVTLDVNNGAGQHEVKFWTRLAGTDLTVNTGWVQLGSTATLASTTSVFDGTAPLGLGTSSGTIRMLNGRLYRALILNGIDGSVAADFAADRDSIPGSSTFVSATTGETWTFHGAASRVSEWADITDYVQEGSVQTGRQYEVDRFNSGSASITWLSESRLFDFDNSASTYFGQLQPMRQFRIRMRRNDQVWPIFRGYCIDWDQTTDSSDNVFFTTVRLADAFALLDATAAPSPYESAVLAKNPTAYFRLHDTNSIPARSGSGSGVWSSTPTLTTPLIANDGSSSWSAAGGIYGKVTPTVTSLNTCIEFWMSTTATTGTIIDANAFGIRVLFYLAAGKLRVYNSATGRYYQTTNVVNTGTAQNIYFNGATNAFFINGVADAGTNALDTPDELGGVTIETGVWYLGTNQARTYPYVGVLDELAIYSTNVGNNYTVGTTPWSGQTTGARVAAILDAIGWPAALRDIDTGDSTMQTVDIASETALGAIQQAADTELGQTYIDEYGAVHHRSRSNLWLQTRSKTSQVTFNDSWSGTTKIYSNQGFSMVRDALLLRNPVTASRANGTTITRQDDTLITTFGRRDYQAPVSYDSSDVVISDRAEFLLSRYKNLQTRLESMTVNVHRDPADLTATIGTTTIGTRITVRRKPLNTGSATSVDQIVEGISHRFAPRVWSTTFRASPLERTVYFILDDATFGVLDDDLLAY